MLDSGGNNELNKNLEAFRLTPGFSDVESLMIIRDAELDTAAAVQQVQSALAHNNLPVPERPGVWQTTSEGYEKLKRVGFLLLPNCNTTPVNGTLEDLCLLILKEENAPAVMEEVDSFLNKLKEDVGRRFPREHKAKLHTYFSVTDDYVSLKIGEAARAGAFDWGSDKLTPLKNFLLQAINDTE